jgi:hypothetical protein
LALFALAAACDQGKQHDEQSVLNGPIHLIGQNISTTQSLPVDQPIRLAFDRLLNPLTVNRQSFVVRDAAHNVVASPIVQYDPVTRVVTLSDPNAMAPAGAGADGGTDGGSDAGSVGSWLLPNQPYTLTLGIPAGNDDTGGIRAIDRATLSPAQNLVIGFQTVPASGAAAADPAMYFCVDVLPIFQQKCSLPVCHGTPSRVPANPSFPDAGGGNGISAPGAGLILDSLQGIQYTAINRAAQGSNTGPRAGVGSSPGHLFGVDMPIIDPGDPANSWLLYKVLLAPLVNQNESIGAVCSGQVTAGHFNTDFDSVDGGSPLAQPLTNNERFVLSQYILGREMPYPSDPTNKEPATSSDNPPLNFDELERVRAWIAEGVSDPNDFLYDCSTCTTGDAGSGDTGAGDSGPSDSAAGDTGAGDASDAAAGDAPAGG